MSPIVAIRSAVVPFFGISSIPYKCYQNTYGCKKETLALAIDFESLIAINSTRSVVVMLVLDQEFWFIYVIRNFQMQYSWIKMWACMCPMNLDIFVRVGCCWRRPCQYFSYFQNDSSKYSTTWRGNSFKGAIFQCLHCSDFPSKPWHKKWLSVWSLHHPDRHFSNLWDGKGGGREANYP